MAGAVRPVFDADETIKMIININHALRQIRRKVKKLLISDLIGTMVQPDCSVLGLSHRQAIFNKDFENPMMFRSAASPGSWGGRSRSSAQWYPRSTPLSWSAF